MLILTASEIERVLPMSAAISAMREAFRIKAAGGVVMPVRQALDARGVNNSGVVGTSLVMPARVEGLALGVKVVSVFPGNSGLGLPSINAAVLLVDPDTGIPTALLEGRCLTAIRTGAVTGLATELLSRPESACLAMFGAGAQAWRQIEAVLTVRDIRRLHLVNRNRDKAATLADDIRRKAPGLEILVSAAEAALAEADIACLATAAREPLFADGSARPGLHINAVGAFKPEMRETPSATVARSRIIVDDRAACLEEAGDLLTPMAEGLISTGHIAGELADVLAGHTPGRTSAREITFFKSVGLALEDAAAGAVAVAAAQNLGLGLQLDM